MPLYSARLCDAEIIIPRSNSSSLTNLQTTGVGITLPLKSSRGYCKRLFESVSKIKEHEDRVS